MAEGDPKVARYVSPGTGAESGLQSHAYREGDRADATTGAAVLVAEVQDREALAELEALLNSLGLRTDADTTLGVIGLLKALKAKDYATQATLAAVLAKLIAAPATEAKQDTLIGHVDGVEGSLTTLNGKDFATDAKLEAVRDRLPSALDGGALSVADAYTAGEALASQAGAGAVLTFTFSSPRDLIWVRSVGDVSYADPFGGTPADGTGVYCADDEPTPITVRASSLKVWAPSDATVYVWGYGG